MTIRRLKPDEIEEIAERFLTDHGRYDNRALQIERTLNAAGLTIIPVAGLGAIAEAYIPAKKGFVFIDEAQYLDAENFRYRFTLAEELAHTLIHRPLFDGMTVDQIRTAQRSLTDDQYLQMEREAKRLAGALLMRNTWFKERYLHFYSVQAKREPSYLKTVRFSIRQLSMDFFVSCHAVAMRALSLRMIDSQELDDLGEMWSAVSPNGPTD